MAAVRGSSSQKWTPGTLVWMGLNSPRISVGASGFGFFLSHGRAPRGTTVGLTTRPLRAEALNVRQVDGAWAVCENTRPVVAFTDGDEARTALAAIKHFQFDAECAVGNGHLGNVDLFVKMR